MMYNSLAVDKDNAKYSERPTESQTGVKMKMAIKGDEAIRKGLAATEGRWPRKVPTILIRIAALCQRVGFLRHHSEFYLVREVPYSMLDGFLQSTIPSRSGANSPTVGRIKESMIAHVLQTYFEDRAECILKGIRPLPATVWFSIDHGIGSTGDEALATIHIATTRYSLCLPL